MILVGKLPQERYPLVSRVPPCLSMKHKQVTLREWDRLANLLTSNEQGSDNSEEKKQKLKAASEELQRGWPDTSKVRTGLRSMILNPKRHISGQYYKNNFRKSYDAWQNPWRRKKLLN